MEKTTKRKSESASAVGVKREHMGHMGLEYMGQDIYLTNITSDMLVYKVEFRQPFNMTTRQAHARERKSYEKQTEQSMKFQSIFLYKN